jgi:hypothetical protein
MDMKEMVHGGDYGGAHFLSLHVQGTTIDAWAFRILAGSKSYI